MTQAHVLLAGQCLSDLLTLTALNPREWCYEVIETDRAVEALIRPPCPQADIAVVCLTGRENVGDLTRLLDGCPDTRFLFLYPAFPPSAALARLISRHRGVILRSSETPVVIVATVVALLAYGHSRLVES
jgi:hypothetical protein